MTIPARFALAGLGEHIVDFARFHQLGVEFGVAADAIVHNHLRRSLLRLGHLTFAASNKGKNVLHTVGAFEKIFLGNILVRHMAIVASGIAAMRRVHPRGIIGCHDVAIDARL